MTDKRPMRATIPYLALNYSIYAEAAITLHKIVFRVPKITRTARTLYEIKGVMWEGVHL